MDMGLSGPFQRLDVLGKKTLKIALQASHTVRQAIWGLLLDGYTGVRIDRNSIPNWGVCRVVPTPVFEESSHSQAFGYKGLIFR